MTSDQGDRDRQTCCCTKVPMYPFSVVPWSRTRERSGLRNGGRAAISDKDGISERSYMDVPRYLEGT